MNATCKFLFGGVVGLTLTASSFAFAEPTSAERNLAESLFQDGKSLMAEGKVSEACPKLAESNRIDPGAGTLTALALCHRAEGRTASAWSEFREVISLARRDGRKDREQVAQDNIAELEPKLSRLKVIVDPNAEAQHVEVRVDDLVYTPATFGQALPTDPGMRRIKASATGKKPFEMTVIVGTEKDEKSITIHALEDDPRYQAAMADRSQNDHGPTSATSSSSQKYIGYGLAGLGVVAVGIGTVFGLSAISKNKDSDSLCPNTTCSNQQGVTAADDARSAATVANIAVIGGAALIVGGLVLVLTSPSKASAAAAALRPSPQRTGITGVGRSVVGLSGSF
jgi:hypothetical protein